MNNTGNVTATRTLQVDGSGRIVVVTVGVPRPHPEGDWECPFSITGIAEPISDAASGLDSLQALLMALEAIRVTLRAGSESYSWEGVEGDAGIPCFVPSYFGQEFSAHIESIIDQEVAKHAEGLRRRMEQKERP